MTDKACYYCGAPVVSGSYQMDHFPVPDRNGGTVTVPACLSCHDMKDRLRFDQWPDELIGEIIAEFPTLNRETKIFIAKAFAMASDFIQQKKEQADVPGRETRSQG